MYATVIVLLLYRYGITLSFFFTISQMTSTNICKNRINSLPFPFRVGRISRLNIRTFAHSADLGS